MLLSFDVAEDAVRGRPRYFVMYEVAQLATLNLDA